MNSDAEDNPESPIAGMPVLKVWDAHHVVAFKVRLFVLLFNRSHVRTFALLSNLKCLFNELPVNCVFFSSFSNVIIGCIMSRTP